MPNARDNEAERLAEALRFNQPLTTLYDIKEDLRRLLSRPDKAAAGR